MSLSYYINHVIPIEAAHGNITHNLVPMAEKVNLYKPLWHPEELQIKKCNQLIPYLDLGIAMLKDDPSLDELNPSNGWGSRADFIDFCEALLFQCKEWPEAYYEVSI